MADGNPIRVLVAEDVATDAELAVRELTRAGLRIESRVAGTKEGFRRALAEFTPDIILSDFTMLQFDGMEALAIARERAPETPFIFVSGTLGEEYAIRALKNGATDYVLKTNLIRLPAAVERALAEARERRATREAEQALRKSEERFRNTLDTMMEGCQIIAFDWRYLYVNASAAQQGRSTVAALTGRTMMEAYPGIENTSMFSALKRCMESRVPAQLENEFIHPDGTRAWFELAIQPVPEGIFILSLDTTERRRAERALRAKEEELRAMTQQLWQAAKLATMGEIAASIAHELNNPLGTISLRLEGLLAQTAPEDPRRRAIEILQQETERMSALVANLLQFSRRSAPQISGVDLKEEIANSLELIHYHLRKHSVAVIRDFEPDVPLVQADRQQLRQLFLNLFSNACDAMAGGGTLTLRLRNTRKSVAVEVADTGAGIAAEDLPRLSEAFFTTKPEGKGTGLGLAICRRIAREHRGTIEIESPGPGRGATVRVTLPVNNGSNGGFLRASPGAGR